MKELTEGDKRLIADIEKYGWHVIKIMEDNNNPPFCYSVGFYESFKHPEIIIIGLKLELAHILINNIGEDIKNGLGYQSGKFYSDILDNYKCRMLQVSQDNYDEYFGYAKWYYKNKDFPVLQCIYPTVKGIYPWETDWPEDIKDLQPVLGELTDSER